MFKRSKEPEKKGSEKREDLLVSFLKDAHFVFAIIQAFQILLWQYVGMNKIRCCGQMMV